MQRPFIHPHAYSILILLSTAIITVVFILLLLLFHYCYCHKTVATDKLCRVSLLPGAAELTNHLSRLINILWLSLCRINKFGFYFPRRLLRSPILVGYQLESGTFPGNASMEVLLDDVTLKVISLAPVKLAHNLAPYERS